MCQAIREMWNDGWNDGMNAGLSRGISQGVTLSAAVFSAVRSGLLDNREIAEQCNCTIEDVENIRNAFDI